MQNKFVIVCVNICVFLFLLAGLELLGQTAYFLKKGHPLYQGKTFINDQLYERHPFLGVRIKKNVVIDKKEGKITTTDIGTRWTGAPADDRDLIRVAVVGGSSTFGSMVSDADSWAALLQGLLGDQYAVINYGNPGYSTAESIIQMALLVPEKNPDIVLFYGGWNDIANYHVQELGPDYYAQGIKQIETNMENERFKNSEWLWFQASERIFLVRLARIIRSNLDKANHARLSGFDTPDPFVDRIYLRNLQTLKLLALGKNTDTDMIFVPQVLNYKSFRFNKTPRPWSPFIKDNAMPELLDRFNKIMNDVCQAGEPHCAVINDVLAVHWESGDFKDDGHFSPEGGLKFAQVLAERVKSLQGASS